MSGRVVSMGRQHLKACGLIVEDLELFQMYRMSAESATKLLQAALDEGRSDLRVALDRAGEVAGFAWLIPKGAFDRSGYLRLIATDPERRRVGVGRRLVDAIEDTHLRLGGITALVSSNNQPAKQFYETLGYGQVGVLPGYLRPDLDELIYFKAAPR